MIDSDNFVGPAYPDGEGSRLGVFKGADEALSHGH